MIFQYINLTSYVGGANVGKANVGLRRLQNSNFESAIHSLENSNTIHVHTNTPHLNVCIFQE